MVKYRAERARVFKSKWFSKEARKAGISDKELCEAFAEVLKGQCDPLGGNVFKKRLNENMHRSIILSSGGGYWFYQYLFAKRDRENIDDDELAEFKRLAKGHGKLNEAQMAQLIKDKAYVEICHDSET